MCTVSPKCLAKSHLLEPHPCGKTVPPDHLLTICCSTGAPGPSLVTAVFQHVAHVCGMTCHGTSGGSIPSLPLSVCSRHGCSTKPLGGGSALSRETWTLALYINYYCIVLYLVVFDGYGYINMFSLLQSLRHCDILMLSFSSTMQGICVNRRDTA